MAGHIKIVWIPTKWPAPGRNTYNGPLAFLNLNTEVGKTMHPPAIQ